MRAAGVVLVLALAGSAFGAGLTPVDEAGFRKLVASQKGKVLLVNFWATWCSPCRAEMPQLVKMEASLRAKGFSLVTVSADEPEQEADAAKFIAKVSAPGPSYIKRARNDEKFIDAIDPKWSGALPALFLYDRTGRKVRSFFGETDLKALEAEIRKLL